MRRRVTGLSTSTLSPLRTLRTRHVMVIATPSGPTMRFATSSGVSPFTSTPSTATSTSPTAISHEKAAGPPGITLVTKSSPCRKGSSACQQQQYLKCRKLIPNADNFTHARSCVRSSKRAPQKRTSVLTLILQPIPHIVPDVGGVGISAAHMPPRSTLGDTAARPGETSWLPGVVGGITADCAPLTLDIC